VIDDYQNLDIKNYVKDVTALKEKFARKIKINLGIELGLETGEKAKLLKELVSEIPFEFVIGSVHMVDGEWIDLREYLGKRTAQQATLDYYDYLHQCILEFDDFDVLGHVNVIDRYVSEIQPLSVYEDKLTEIFKLVISKNKGIEINTSGKRKGLPQWTMPTPEIFALYKKLGGKIVTVGSDAHRAKDVGKDIDLAEVVVCS
jgi:histidinol-phosphatase (PHP family)